jgi:class 3 adenylate cyclase/tetratricopeptide (TPR) repeat protein
MSSEHQKILAGIAALGAQREILGDTVVDASIAALRSKLIDSTTSTAADPTQTLRQVSILFLDIVGSTTLSQHLDPEDIHSVMDGALARFSAVVSAHHGKVLQYAGDSLLAAFGATEAKEDDADRAVRCGLALLAEGKGLGADVQTAQLHAGFDLRVGIHTGAVLLGGGVNADGTIRGIAVNIAARMEQTAPAGALRISSDTYRLVRGTFDVEPLDPITIKGVDAPIQTYLVQRAKPRAFRVATRGIEGVATRMIGRDGELAQLQDAFKHLHSQGKPAAVTVVAEAGIGKSRLLYEFEAWAQSQLEAYCVFQARANPQTQGQAYGLLREILAWRLQIGDGDSMESAKQKIEQGIAPLFRNSEGSDEEDDRAQAHAHLLGHLIGLDFGDSKHIARIKDDIQQLRNRAFHTAAQMFRRVAFRDRMPIVLLLDDLHWADDGSLDFLNYLTQANQDVPMLVLALTRPALFERRSDWIGADVSHLRIDLLPLDTASSRKLADELLMKVREIPVALRELISVRAEGNPFYMEELVKMLVDEGAIQAGENCWTVNPGKLLNSRVPKTLTGVLQARLDSLKLAERLALQQASVIGFVFWDRALGAIDARAIAALPALVQHELTLPRQDTSLEGVREYAFKHQILHQVTYDTVLKPMRRECHARVAAWLAGLTGARANDFLASTAEHFEGAGNNAQACEFFTRAAEHAAGRFAHKTVLGHVDKALGLVDEDDVQDRSGRRAGFLLRWRLLDVRERTLDLLGKRPEQQADIAVLQALAEELDDNQRRAEVAWRRSDIAMRIADYPTQESAARQSMELARRIGDGVLGLRAQQRLAYALCDLGNVAEGKALALEGLAAARGQGLRAMEVRFLNVLAVVANIEGDLVAYLETTRQTLPINRELGERRLEAIALCNLGASWLGLGECEQARSNLDEGLRLTRELGDRSQEPYPLIYLAKLALRQGDVALALTLAQSALEIGIAAQNPHAEAIALCWLGNAKMASGQHEAAQAALERAHVVALKIGAPQIYDAAAGLARLALAQGDVRKAMQAIEGILVYLGAGGTLEGTDVPQLIRLSCYQVLASTADARANDTLAMAYTELQARAASIMDGALRHSFLNDILEHREISVAWEERQTAKARRH